MSNSEHGRRSFLREQFSSRKFRGGAYATAVSVVVIAVIIVINLIAGRLGLNVDLTADGMYTLSESTGRYVGELVEHIDIYYLAEDGDTFPYYDLDRFIDEFNKFSDNVRIVRKDPIKNPTFAKQYTDEQISRYGFIVVNEDNGRSKYIDTTTYITTELDYNTYSYQVTSLTLEAELVSALRFVTSDILPKLYMTVGHGETRASDDLAVGIAGENIVTADLSLLTAAAVPEDCDVLMIYQPQNDITDEEFDLIRDYMDRGGDLVILTDLTTGSLTNMTRLLRYAGVKLTEGYVIEGDSSHYLMRTPSEIVPVTEDHEITEGITSGRYILMPYANGIMVADDIRSTVNVLPILSSTGRSYAKHELNIKSLEKESGDYEGPFMLGVELVDESGDLPSRTVIYSCMYFLDDGLISGQTYANGDVFYNTLDHLADMDTSVSVRPVSLAEDYITVTSGLASFYALLYIVLVPLAVIAIGIIVTLRRRHL